MIRREPSPGSPGEVVSFPQRVVVCIPTDSVVELAVSVQFAMKVFLLLVHFAVFFHGVHPLDEEYDEVQREEDKLPHYLKDDGIRRVAKLTKDHFNKTLKSSRMMVVLFYYSGNESDPEADRSWKTDEQMLEVRCFHRQAHITTIQQAVSRPQIRDLVYISREN